MRQAANDVFVIVAPMWFGWLMFGLGLLGSMIAAVRAVTEWRAGRVDTSDMVGEEWFHRARLVPPEHAPDTGDNQ